VTFTILPRSRGVENCEGEEELTMTRGLSAHPSSMYLRLAEGHDDVFAGASRLRRAITLAATVALLMTSLLFAASAPGSDLMPWKVDDALASPGDDDPDRGPGGDDEDEDEDEGRDNDDDEDDTGTDNGTGAETRGNTDQGGQDTGKSTRGETDGADDTGKTEATEGTGAESRGNTDDGDADTGASTKGETDPGDDTGKSEQR
jgi:hypothetical protein